MISHLQKTCRGITIIPIDDSHVENIEDILKSRGPQPFKGTLSIHQVLWSCKASMQLRARRLSCIKCSADNYCEDFEIGVIETKNLTEPPLSSPVSPTPSCFENIYNKMSNRSIKRKSIFNNIYSSGSESDNEPLSDIKKHKASKTDNKAANSEIIEKENQTQEISNPTDEKLKEAAGSEPHQAESQRKVLGSTDQNITQQKVVYRIIHHRIINDWRAYGG